MRKRNGERGRKRNGERDLRARQERDEGMELMFQWYFVYASGKKPPNMLR